MKQTTVSTLQRAALAQGDRLKNSLSQLVSSLGRFATLGTPLQYQEPEFRSSGQYWESRYASGGSSGAGSYGRLASFKAFVLNDFVATERIDSVVELGCGDGAQLALARYPRYIGVDVSDEVVRVCRKKFSHDPTKAFVRASEVVVERDRADVALSLDVIYHLVEDDAFDEYMRQLIALSRRHLVVYSSNFDGPGPAPHIRHRHFTRWLQENAPEWRHIRTVPNIYPWNPNRAHRTSWADFYFFVLDGQHTGRTSTA